MRTETIYHLLGKISITFASFEHASINLLDYLLTKGENTLIGPYILNDISIARLIQQISSVAELRLWKHKSTLADLKKIMKNIDTLRSKRNLFLHGYWNVNELSDDADSVTVFDFKPMLDKKSGTWQELKTERVSRTKLKELLKDVSSTLEKLRVIDKNIRKLKLR
jgi:hypothetical protein